MFKYLYLLQRYIAVISKNEKLYRKTIQKRLQNSNFTIISNNCWGAGVMEDVGMPFTTPIVGAFFYAPCYINFLKNITHNIILPLAFIEHSKYEAANLRRIQKWYPIGLIGESEIHFIHYTSDIEAREKWNRRKVRINFDNLFVAFSDRDQCTMELIEEFDKLPFTNKIFLSSKYIPEIKSLVWLKNYRNQSFIGDIYTNRWGYRKYFDVVKWLNKSKSK